MPHTRTVGIYGIVQLCFTFEADGSVGYAGEVLGWPTKSGRLTVDEPLHLRERVMLMDYEIHAEIVETDPVVVSAVAHCGTPTQDSAVFGPYLFVVPLVPAEVDDPCTPRETKTLS